MLCKDSKKLFVISKVDLENSTISLSEYNSQQTVPSEKNSDDEDNETALFERLLKEETIYYKNLDPSEYYLQILGIFTYQLFFAGFNNLQRNKSLLIHIAQTQYYTSGRGSALSDKDFYSANKLEKVFVQLTKMYVRSMLIDFENSYFKKGDNAIERFTAYWEDFRKLRGYLSEIFVNIEHHTPGEEVKYESSLQFEYVDKMDFNDLLTKFGDFQMKDSRISSKDIDDQSSLPIELKIVRAGLGEGNVQKSPNCEYLKEGAKVTLEAIAEAGSKFEKWVTDDEESSENPKEFIVKRNSEIRVYFAESGKGVASLLGRTR
ncbi:MAG: hypothetical protein GY803_18800 [Chloroflexi bacterium]|nr:hypothetical protein [Chloroflexota bacterium]